jgi:hypothetical protein
VSLEERGAPSPGAAGFILQTNFLSVIFFHVIDAENDSEEMFFY